MHNRVLLSRLPTRGRTWCDPGSLLRLHPPGSPIARPKGTLRIPFRSLAASLLIAWLLAVEDDLHQSILASFVGRMKIVRQSPTKIVSTSRASTPTGWSHSSTSNPGRPMVELTTYPTKDPPASMTPRIQPHL